MTLAAPDIEQIEAIVQRALDRRQIEHFPPHYDFNVMQRIIRIEEELKHQRELMLQGFAQTEKRFEEINKRFEQMYQEMNKRFEQVDKRLDQVDKRFEQVDKRLDQIDKRLDQIDKRFEQVDKRLDQVDKRFEQQHQEIMSIHQEIKQQMRWSVGLMLGVGGLLLAILRLLG